MIHYKTMLEIVAKAPELALSAKFRGYLALFWQIFPNEAGATRKSPADRG
jgi:hypothetical protein